MEWTTLVAALVGAAIATATTLLTENRRDRREAATEWWRTRLDMYAPYLSGLAQACGGLGELSRSKRVMTDDEREDETRRLFAPCHELRHRFELVAPPDVLEPGLEYFRRARDLRNLVGASGERDRAKFRNADTLVFDARSLTISAMQVDLAPRGRARKRPRSEGRKRVLESQQIDES
jgi:hypothetical protein